MDHARDDNLRGAAYMTAAMLLFAIEDLLIKVISATLPTWQVILFLAIGGALAAGIALSVRGERHWSPACLSTPVMIRNAAEVVGTLSFVTALALVPLSSASAILQSAPLLVALGAALFLKERVGWRRWSAIGVGFIGVLLIVRPGMAAFDPMSLFALLGTLGLAARDLATRVAPPALSSLQLSFLAFMTLIPFSLLFGLWLGTSFVWPDLVTVGLMVGAALIGTGAYATVIAAMRAGDVAFVTGFRYSRIIFALILAGLVLGERPDMETLIGATIVVGAGLFTLFRERKLQFER